MGQIAINDTAAAALGDEARDHYAGEATQDIMEIALTRSPYDTGHMHDEHKIVKVGVGVYLIIADTGYSWYVHQGTSNQRAQPWLTDSIDIYAQRRSGRRNPKGVG